MSNKQHWENIYTTKTPEEVSWTQVVPQTSLDLIAKFNLPKSAHIIDIGGGDSLLADQLLELGYTNISVLDISEAAIKRAKKRLGDKANQVTWIVKDITCFSPDKSYDLWHDRAVFHFLTNQKEIENYLELVRVNTNSIVLATFSKNGPHKCSGLEITQYSAEDINNTFGPQFQILESLNQDHITPFKTIQNFTFARMSKKQTRAYLKQLS